MKLGIFVLIGGGLNHLRDILKYGWPNRNYFLENLLDASFTALPMCTFALLLIGHLNSLQRRLYMQATRDTLTGLHNRRWFIDNTPERLRADQTLMIVDIDRFKTVNDTYGHAVGDACLQKMGQHLTSNIRHTDFSARIGGEEFAILLNDAAGDFVRHIADRLCRGFAFETGTGQVIQVTSSVGVSANAATRAQALKSADDAVYQAKAAGRACYIIADRAQDADAPYLPAFVG